MEYVEHDYNTTIFATIDGQDNLHYYEVPRSLAETIPAISKVDSVVRRDTEHPEYYNWCYAGMAQEVEPVLKEAGIAPKTGDFEMLYYHEKVLETKLLDQGVDIKEARLLSDAEKMNTEALLEAVTVQTPKETVAMAKDVIAHPDRAAMYGTRGRLITDYGIPKEEANRAADTKEHAAFLHEELRKYEPLKDSSKVAVREAVQKSIQRQTQTTMFAAIDHQDNLHYYKVPRSLAETIPAIQTLDCIAEYRPDTERPEYHNECYFGTLREIEPAMKEAGIAPETNDCEIKYYYEVDLEKELLDRGVTGKDARFLSDSFKVNSSALLEAVTVQTPEETVAMARDVIAHPDRADMYGTQAILITDYGVPKEEAIRAADTKEHAAILHAKNNLSNPLDFPLNEVGQMRREYRRKFITTRTKSRVHEAVQDAIKANEKSNTYEEKAKAVAPKRVKLRLHSHQSNSKEFER